jgi:hypothetical protein
MQTGDGCTSLPDDFSQWFGGALLATPRINPARTEEPS